MLQHSTSFSPACPSALSLSGTPISVSEVEYPGLVLYGSYIFSYVFFLFLILLKAVSLIFLFRYFVLVLI